MLFLLYFTFKRFRRGLRIIYETYYRTMISYLVGECRSYSSVYQSASESSIPSKIVTIRKGGPKWLSCNIRKMIRQKNRIHRKAKQAALKIALVISFVINSIPSVRKSESQFTLNKFCLSFS
jgi:hypothetical protein